MISLRIFIQGQEDEKYKYSFFIFFQKKAVLGKNSCSDIKLKILILGDALMINLGKTTWRLLQFNL